MALKSFLTRLGPKISFEGMIFTLTTSCFFNLWTENIGSRGGERRAKKLMDSRRITFLGNIVFGSVERNDFEWDGEGKISR